MIDLSKILPVLFVLLSMLSASLAHAAFDWRSLPALPDREGFAGSYAGETGGALLVAGGANFPGKRPWEGGTKVWYDQVFALEPGARNWRLAGRLPQAGGYGVSASVSEGFVLAGGGDARHNFREVWLARWNGNEVVFEPLPALPLPLSQSAGALVGRTLYIAGGLNRPEDTQAQRALYALDFDRLESGWRRLDDCPGPERILATAGGAGGFFYLLGGARLVSDSSGKPQREWLRDAWRYASGTGWKRLAALPRSAVAAPSPAPFIEGRLLVLGGDDGTQAATAPTEHRGFPRGILAYDPVSDCWAPSGELPFSLVTTPAVLWQGSIVVPGGEARPGIRSPQVWASLHR